jgi:HTH-type transcriptional regulator/antitoxin HigA
LESRGWSQEKLAAKMGRPYQTVNGIVNGHKMITADTAIDLGNAFGTSAMLWLNLETAYQLYKASQRKKIVETSRQASARKTVTGRKAKAASRLVRR